MGSLAGRDRGGRLGRAGEFEEYRPWRPGEDLRALDVRVYRRLRRRVARVDREDSALPLTLLIDRSASMADPARERCVRELATFLLALARARGEPRRVVLLETTGAIPVPTAEPSAVDAILDAHPARGTLDFVRALRTVPRSRLGPGRVLFLGDGFGLEEETDLRALLPHGRIIWLAPWTRAELRPEIRGSVTLVSREGEPPWRGRVEDETVERYTARHRAWWHRIVTWLRVHGGEGQRCIAEEGALGAISAGLEAGRWVRR